MISDGSISSSLNKVAGPFPFSHATRGLEITPSPTSGRLTAQETTTQDSTDAEPDGASVSCPGRSEVAEIKSFEVTERGEFPLAQDLPEVDQL